MDISDTNSTQNFVGYDDANIQTDGGFVLDADLQSAADAIRNGNFKRWGNLVREPIAVSIEKYKWAGDNAVLGLENTVGPDEPIAGYLEPLAKHFNHLAATFGGQGDGTRMKFNDAGLDNVRSLSSNMDNWQGHLRDAFVENYANHFPGIIRNQGMVAAHLRNRVATMGHVYELRRRNVLRVAEHALTALESLTDSGGKQYTIAMGFTVAAATLVVGVGSIVTAGVLPAALASAGAMHAAAGGIGVGTLGIIGGTLAGAYADKDEVPLGGDSGIDIAENVKSALQTVDERFETEHNNILKGLEADAELLQERAQKDPQNKLRPITPKADGTVQDGDLVLYE